MAPQRPHRQWQVNANGRLKALFSMGRDVDGSQIGRYTKVKRVYIAQCTSNWLKHKFTIIFGYFIPEILITVVTAKPFVDVGVLVLFIMSEVSPGETDAKRNGRFFPDTQIIMTTSSNLYNFWWVHKMHEIGHFLCKIYWLFALTRSALGFKCGKRIIFQIKLISW